MCITIQVYLQVHELCIVCITCINILTLDNQYTMFDIIQYNMHMSNVYNYPFKNLF